MNGGAVNGEIITGGVEAEFQGYDLSKVATSRLLDLSSPLLSYT